MRDPNRLDSFYVELCKIHKEFFPDWRFMQFLSNFTVWYGADPFYMEEKIVIAKLKEYVFDLTGKNLD